MKENDVLCVPAGVRSNVRNPGIVPLKLYTLFSPPRLPAGTVLHTKQDAMEAQRTHHAPVPPVSPPAHAPGPAATGCPGAARVAGAAARPRPAGNRGTPLSVDDPRCVERDQHSER